MIECIFEGKGIAQNGRETGFDAAAGLANPEAFSGVGVKIIFSRHPVEKQERPVEHALGSALRITPPGQGQNTAERTWRMPEAQREELLTGFDDIDIELGGRGMADRVFAHRQKRTDPGES